MSKFNRIIPAELWTNDRGTLVMRMSDGTYNVYINPESAVLDQWDHRGRKTSTPISILPGMANRIVDAKLAVLSKIRRGL